MNATNSFLDYYLKQYREYRPETEEHVKRVTSAATSLAERLRYPRKDLVYTASILHDIGKIKLPAAGSASDMHNRIGYNMVLKDRRLKKRFSDKDIKAIAHAVIAHSSRDPEYTPKSTLAKIISDADRTDTSFSRYYDYNVRYRPHLPENTKLLQAAEALFHKYRPEGKAINSIAYPETKEYIQSKLAPIRKAYDSKDIQALKDMVSRGL